MNSERETLRVSPGPQEVDPVRYSRRRSRISSTLGIAVPTVLFLSWQFAADRGLIDTRFFPAPSTIFETARGMIRDGTLLSDLRTTVSALLIGITAGAIVGIATGVALGLSWIVRSALEPLLSALYTVPKLAILPLLLLIFGLGQTPKIMLIAIGVWFIFWISVLEGILDIPEGYIETAESFGVTGWHRFASVTIPAILPQIFLSLRLGVGIAVLVTVGVEFVNGDSGVGYRIWHSWSLFAADQMYVGIVTVALLGYLLAQIVRLAARLTIRWAPENRR